MQAHELYAAILGIESPWRVESVELQLECGEVHVRLAHADGEQWPCAECGSVCRLYDHQAERRWRHLDTRYMTLVNDLERSRVLYVAEERKQSSLDGFWPTLSAEQMASIEAVAMDMWDPYVASTRAHLPAAEGKMVFDKFHVAKHLGEAVDQVRRREHKRLKASGDDRLSGTRYDWLHSGAAMQPADRREFDALRQSGLKTARAWALKETAMALYSYVCERPARKHFRWWWNWAQRSRLEPIKRVARMLKRRFENAITYLRHRIANAGSESLNAKIQWVKYTARGFRNRQNFINAIYFHCGGLDMNPVPTTP